MHGGLGGIFEVFGDETAVRILIIASDDPVSVEEIADVCGIASATAYRKVNHLAESGLLAERNAISEEGDHYSTYETAVEEITFTITDGELRVSVESEWNMSDRLDAFWADLDDSLSTSTEFTIGLPSKRQSEGSSD